VIGPATVYDPGLVVLKQERDQGWSLVLPLPRTPTPTPTHTPTPNPNPNQERDQGWSLVGESERTLKPSGQLEATLEQASKQWSS
jgi:hypothetical protein